MINRVRLLTNRGVYRRVLAGVLYVLIVTALFFAGRYTASLLKSSFISDNTRLMYLFDISAADMLKIQRLLAHPDPIIRSAGYYGLLETTRVETEYLIEKYKEEHDTSVKRTILFLLFEMGETGAIDEIKRDAPKEIQEYIESTLTVDETRLPEINNRIIM